MTMSKKSIAALFTACGKNDALRARFMADPRAVLAEYDMSIPDDIVVKVVEDPENRMRITLPAPPDGDTDLSDDDLANAAGGPLLQQQF